MVEPIGFFTQVAFQIRVLHAALTNAEQIEKHLFRPVNITAERVHRHPRRGPSFPVEKIMYGVVCAHMSGEEPIVGGHRHHHATMTAARKVPVEIRVDDEHVRLVESDEPMQRRLTMSIHQAAIDVLDRRGNELLEKRGRLIVEPRVHAKPGRMRKVLQSDDRFETLPAARGEPVGIAVKGPEIECGRFRAFGRCGRLHTRPFDAQPEGIESHCVTVGEVLLVPIPEICRQSGAHHASLRFDVSPIVLRLARPVITAFALIARTGNAP